MIIKQTLKSFLFIQAMLIGLCYCSSSDCNSSNPLVGCTDCNNSNYLVLNISSNKFACTNVTSNCIMIDSQQYCLQCYPGYLVNRTIDSNNATMSSACLLSNQTYSGCKTITNGTCTSCISSLYNLNNGTCQLLTYDYCWKVDTTGCTQCSDQNIISANNCSINTSICGNFDYHKWVCTACPAAYTIHESGIFCYNPTDRINCLVISASSCLQCNFGYFLNGTQCQLDTNFVLQYQLLPTSYYYNSTASTKKICMDYKASWDSTSLSCKANLTLTYCLTVSTTNSSQCTQCVQSSYLSSGSCYPCSSQHSNCLLCDINNCFQCIPTYYLVLQTNNYTISQVLSGLNTPNLTKCLPCSIYSCKYCRSQFDSNGNFNVRCDKCLFGFKLHNHTCISCPSNTFFSQTLRICAPCNDTNCMYCNTDKYTCDQCNENMYFNGNICVSMTPILQSQSFSAINTSLNSIYEILNKSLPYSSTNIINDVKLLMTYCAGSSNGFACLCQASANITYSSLCYPINSNLTLTPLSITQFVTNSSTKYPTSYIQQKSDLLVLLSELPKYDWQYFNNLTTSELLSNTQFTNYLQITTNYIRNHPTKMSTSAYAVSQLVFNKFYKSFDPYRPTIFYGPGYYFKYTPQNPIKDDTSVVSLSTNTVASVVYIYFNSTIDPTIERITGTAFVFLNQPTSSQLNLQIKKISFLGSKENYVIMFNDKAQSLTISSDSEGYITINSISTSINGSINAYYVSSTTAGANFSDLFASQRIQNLIYRVAFIYILIFLTLYLTLIPFCALFDCVDNKSHKRKIKASQEGSYQGIKHRGESEMEEEIALKINYKDFFPIYNIANTQRPRRLLKLCLFLVNSQHSITFLSLIYFNLPGGQPLIAVLLAIPAYLCTVILGYLCGLFTLKVPGKLKYLINLVTLGYWILWIPIMSSFVSYQYAPYVFTFAIIFFFIDMLIDFLQTLLMYFTIKQQSRQIKLFKALSRWLSYRGYYEFDKMAKDIDQVRDNS